MTPKQKQQFNFMLAGLKRLAKGYQTTSQLQRGSKGDYGLDYTEALEMSYENMQNDAAYYSKGIREIK